MSASRAGLPHASPQRPVAVVVEIALEAVDDVEAWPETSGSRGLGRGMERLPARQRNSTGRAPVIPAALRSATNPSLGRPLLWVHSANTTWRPRLDKSGTPTHFHSASVRTSTSTALGSSLSSAQLSCGGDIAGVVALLRHRQWPFACDPQPFYRHGRHVVRSVPEVTLRRSPQSRIQVLPIRSTLIAGESTPGLWGLPFELGASPWQLSRKRPAASRLPAGSSLPYRRPRCCPHLDGPAGSGLVLACLDNEILNTANGVCEPSAGGDVSDDYSGNVTGDGDSLEEVDGVPCTGADTGKCIGLQESAD